MLESRTSSSCCGCWHQRSYWSRGSGGQTVRRRHHTRCSGGSEAYEWPYSLNRAHSPRTFGARPRNRGLRPASRCQGPCELQTHRRWSSCLRLKLLRLRNTRQGGLSHGLDINCLLTWEENKPKSEYCYTGQNPEQDLSSVVLLHLNDRRLDHHTFIKPRLFLKWHHHNIFSYQHWLKVVFKCLRKVPTDHILWSASF